MKIKCANPDEIEFELTMQMSLRNWKKLNNDLSDCWPSSSLSREINNMVKQAEKVFYPEN